MMKEKLFVTKTVREIIFDGYHDPLFDEVMKIKDVLHSLPGSSSMS